MAVAAQSSQVNAPAKKRHLSRAQRRKIQFFTFISPWLIGFVLLGVIPLLLGLATSFTNYDGLNLPYLRFVGFNNYIRAFNDSDLWFAFGQTVKWGLINIPLWVGGSFALALILNQGIKARGVFRTIYYIPSLIPVAIAVNAWRIILERNFGMLNVFISEFTPAPVAIPWMSEYSLAGMSLIALWSGLGSGMIIFLAGLQGIPDELVEASKIDGASRFQIFRHITLPLMTPVIFFQLIMALIGAFQQMNLPLVVSQIGNNLGVPPRPVYLYMIHTYRQIFSFQRFGYGTAMLWLLFIFILALTLFVFWTQKFWVYYDSPE